VGKEMSQNSVQSSVDGGENKNQKRKGHGASTRQLLPPRKGMGDGGAGKKKKRLGGAGGKTVKSLKNLADSCERKGDKSHNLNKGQSHPDYVHSPIGR